MKFYLKLSFALLILCTVALSFSCKKDDKDKIPSDKVPVIETVGAVVVHDYDVFCAGVIGTDNGYTVTERGFCWSSTNISPTTADNRNYCGAGAGSFMDTIHGLIPSSVYFIRAYATNAAGTAYGSTLSFTTNAGALPQVEIISIDNVTATSAVIGGNVKYYGGSQVTTRGIIWGINANITIDNSLGKTTDGTGIGAFTSTVSGLTQRTTYFVKAYATNATGTSYGSAWDFITVGTPYVQTEACTHVNGTLALLGGIITDNGGYAPTTWGLCWSTSQNPTIDDNKNYSFTDTLRGLTQNTTYYVRAYATNPAGTGYGNTVIINPGFTIGSFNEGGYVFYNDGTGHGYVCADNILQAKWGCYGAAMGTRDQWLLDYSETNTNSIVSGCGEAGIAARLCYNLNYNTYTDWVLPSREGLELIGSILYSKHLGNIPIGSYWCSSEINEYKAYYFYFYNNGTLTLQYTDKDLTLSLLPIRHF
jgi:hypothetical protein